MKKPVVASFTTGTYPGKLFPPGSGRTEPHCVDCGIENTPMMCPPCAERLAEDIVEQLRYNDNKPTLKLYEVAIDPLPDPRYNTGSTDWRFVMVLSTDNDSAVDSAFDVLGLPNGRADLTWNVHECKGPFVKGSILSVKSIPQK